MNTHRKLWIGLAALLLVSFSALLWVGSGIHRVMPPIPTAVVTAKGARS
jgi:nitric oxide reductase subunit B